MNFHGLLHRYFPILDWGSKYNRKTFTKHLIVAGIVAVMMIPQSLIYALRAMGLLRLGFLSNSLSHD